MAAAPVRPRRNYRRRRWRRRTRWRGRRPDWKRMHRWRGRRWRDRGEPAVSRADRRMTARQASRATIRCESLVSRRWRWKHRRHSRDGPRNDHDVRGRERRRRRERRVRNRAERCGGRRRRRGRRSETRIPYANHHRCDFGVVRAETAVPAGAGRTRMRPARSSKAAPVAVAVSGRRDLSRCADDYAGRHGSAPRAARADWKGTNLTGGNGGAGGLGRVRMSVVTSSCTVTGAFTPPLQERLQSVE